MKRILSVLSFIIIINYGYAQDFIGMTNSNYSGLYGVGLQPASIVDSRISFDLIINSTNAELGNTVISVSRNDLLGDSSIGSYLKFRDVKGDRQVYANVNAMGPSAMWHYKHKYYFALTTRTRAIVNIHNVDADMAKLLSDTYLLGDTTALNFSQGLSTSGFGLKAMVWGEVGATFGMKILEVGPHYLKGAGTIKYLKSGSSAYFVADDIDYKVIGDSVLSINSAGIKYGIAKGVLENANSLIDGSRSGLGIDLGIVYEYRPEKDKAKYLYSMDGKDDNIRYDLNKYKYRVGLSILDIGKVGFNTGAVASSYNISGQNIALESLGQSIPQIDSTWLATFNGTKQKDKYSMRLPTAISLQFDYHIWRGLYVNSTTFLGFKQKNIAVSQLSRFSITPRLESKNAEIAFPMSYALKKLNVGMAFRVPLPSVLGSHFVFGSNNLFNLIGGNAQITSANVYVGFRYQFNNGLLKDSDGDGYSNKVDKNKKRSDIAGAN